MKSWIQLNFTSHILVWSFLTWAIEMVKCCSGLYPVSCMLKCSCEFTAMCKVNTHKDGNIINVVTDQKETGLVRRLEYSYHAHSSGNCFIATWSNGACLVVKVHMHSNSLAMFPASHAHPYSKIWKLECEGAWNTITFYVYPLNVVVCPQWGMCLKEERGVFMLFLMLHALQQPDILSLKLRGAERMKGKSLDRLF